MTRPQSPIRNVSVRWMMAASKSDPTDESLPQGGLRQRLRDAFAPPSVLPLIAEAYETLDEIHKRIAKLPKPSSWKDDMLKLIDKGVQK